MVVAYYLFLSVIVFAHDGQFFHIKARFCNSFTAVSLAVSMNMAAPTFDMFYPPQIYDFNRYDVARVY